MTQRICSIAECGKFVQARGWCAQHYMRWRKHGDVETVLKRPGKARGPNPSTPCAGPDCTNLVGDGSQTGLCKSHLAQVRRGAQLTPIQPWARSQFPPCCVPECGRPGGIKGYCKGHLARFRRGLDVTMPIQAKTRRFGCLVDECKAEHVSSGYCSRHYNVLISRFKSYGITRQDADEMLAAQGGACAVCRQPFSLDQLAIDHDHDCCPKGRSCGRCVRGLLCGLCNLGLGSFRDNVDSLKQAIRYLNTTRVSG